MVFDHCPTHMNIRVLRRPCRTTGLQASPQGLNVYLCILMCLHFPLAVMTTVGVLGFQFLCPYFLEDGAGIIQTSVGEQNVALSLVLSLQTLFARSHASLRARRSCYKVSSGVLSSTFGAQSALPWNRLLRWLCILEYATQLI